MRVLYLCGYGRRRSLAPGLDSGRVALYDRDAGHLCASNLIKVYLGVAGRFRVAELFEKFKT